MNIATPHPSTLTASDIAEMSRVGRSTVSNWRKRHDDFPAPIDDEAGNPRFDAEEVRSWLARHGKEATTPDPVQSLFRTLDAWRSYASVDEMADLTADLIVWRYLSDPTSPGFDSEIKAAAQWPQVQAAADGEMILEQMYRYERTHAENGPLFHALDTTGRLLQMTKELHLTLWAIDALEAATLEDAYSSIQDRVTKTLRRGYDSSTSDVLINLITALATTVPGAVHDPVAGSGRLLTSVARRGEQRTTITGQDISRSAAIRARQRLVLSGRTDATIRVGDVLQVDGFDPGTASVVVMEPPYGMRADRGTSLELDPRFAFGTPPRGRMDLAWPQLAIRHLAPKGRAFVLQPVGSATRGGAEQKIRASLAQAGTLEAVIALPSGLASYTQIPLNLWVMARPGEARDLGKVLMIDASTSPQIDIEGIAHAVTAWRTGGEARGGLPSMAVPLLDLLAEHTNLDPRRWCRSPGDEIDPDVVRATLNTVGESVAAMRVPACAVADVVQFRTQPVGQTSLGQLQRTGNLEIFRAAARLPGDELEAEGDLVVTGAWIRGEDDDRRIERGRVEGTPVVTQAGDILVQNAGGLAARVDTEGGRLLCSPSFQLIRLASDQLRPEYVAAALVSAQNRSRAQGASIQRIRVQDITVPVISLDEQDRVIAAVTELDTLHRNARAIEHAVSTSRGMLIDALTAGTVQIG